MTKEYGHRRAIRKANEVLERKAYEEQEEAYKILQGYLNGRLVETTKRNKKIVKRWNWISKFLSRGKDPVAWYVNESGDICHYIDEGSEDDLMGGEKV